jgi:hypothetical protein
LLPFALLFEPAFWSAAVPEAFGSELLVAAEPVWSAEEELLFISDELDELPDWLPATEPAAAPL